MDRIYSRVGAVALTDRLVEVNSSHIQVNAGPSHLKAATKELTVSSQYLL